MKVSDLIKVLEQYKDKELYVLNIAGTNEVIKIKNQVIGEYFFLELTQKPDHKFMSDFISLQDGFSVRLRTEEELDSYRKGKIREDRQFNYYFKVGSEVMIDEEVLLDMDREKLSHLFGKKGIVKKCNSDLHAFAHGTSYYHVVEWDGGETTQDGDFGEGVEYDIASFMPKNYVPTIYLKAYQCQEK